MRIEVKKEIANAVTHGAGFITFVRGLFSAVDTHSVLSSPRKHFLFQLTLPFLLLRRKLPRRGKGIVDAVGIRAIKAVAYFASHSFFAILSLQSITKKGSALVYTLSKAYSSCLRSSIA